jgi:hypothetical protein
VSLPFCELSLGAFDGCAEMLSGALTGIDAGVLEMLEILMSGRPWEMPLLESFGGYPDCEDATPNAK